MARIASFGDLSGHGVPTYLVMGRDASVVCEVNYSGYYAVVATSIGSTAGTAGMTLVYESAYCIRDFALAVTGCRSSVPSPDIAPVTEYAHGYYCHAVMFEDLVIVFCGCNAHVYTSVLMRKGNSLVRWTEV